MGTTVTVIYHDDDTGADRVSSRRFEQAPMVIAVDAVEASDLRRRLVEDFTVLTPE